MRTQARLFASLLRRSWAANAELCVHACLLHPAHHAWPPTTPGLQHNHAWGLSCRPRHHPKVGPPTALCGATPLALQLPPPTHASSGPSQRRHPQASLESSLPVYPFCTATVCTSFINFPRSCKHPRCGREQGAVGSCCGLPRLAPVSCQPAQGASRQFTGWLSTERVLYKAGGAPSCAAARAAAAIMLAGWAAPALRRRPRQHQLS